MGERWCSLLVAYSMVRFLSRTVEDSIGFHHIINYIALGDLEVKMVVVQFWITFHT